MGRAYKNFWSLNVDEAVVTGILRDNLNKNVAVFMPASAQMKNVDLALINVVSKKIITVQVKGSRAYEPRKSEVANFGEGSAGWFLLKSSVIHDCSADFFIFLIYVLEENKKSGRRDIVPHTITIPAQELQRLCLLHKRKAKGNRYNLIIWINPKKKKAFDTQDRRFDLSDFLDNSGFQMLKI
ncbi:MAG: hypothetical protein HQL24_09940 [Candidatus Omnitrophica bacterium]|nr:hypothetical protein [Candidatus Omnitrophota bacterium]